MNAEAENNPFGSAECSILEPLLEQAAVLDGRLAGKSLVRECGLSLFTRPRRLRRQNRRNGSGDSRNKRK
jgi:hypothetical protein